MSKKYNRVKKNYDNGSWNKQMVHDAVTKEWITEEEYELIVGEPYIEDE
jgi:hypothetical protein